MAATKRTVGNIGALDKAVLRRYLELPQPDHKVMATYIWIDGTGENLRGIKRSTSFFLLTTFVFCQ